MGRYGEREREREKKRKNDMNEPILKQTQTQR